MEFSQSNINFGLINLKVVSNRFGFKRKVNFEIIFSVFFCNF